MRSIEEIEKDIAACQDELADVLHEMADVRHEMNTFEPDEKEAEDAFDDMLDECYEPFRIGRMEYRPSYVLREVDPIAYHCGLNDFVDSEPIDRWSGYGGLEDELADLEAKLSELEDELEEAKDAHEEGEDNQ